MGKKNLIFIILLIFSIFLNCNSGEKQSENSSNNSAQNKKREIVLKNLQILNTPHDISYPYENDINWKPVEIPFINKLPKPYFQKSSNFWLRGEFNIEAFDKYRFSDYYAIDLGLIAANETVYINKQHIGELQLRVMYKWLWPRGYLIPAHIELKEKNEVYMRFIVTENKYITLLSDISIQDQSSYIRSQNWYTFLYTQIPMGFSILLVGLVIILLRNYFHYNNKRYLLYMFYILHVCISILLIYSPTNFLNPAISITIMNSLFPITILLTILIFQSFYGVYLTKQNRLLISILLLVSICIFIRYYFSFNFNIITQTIYNIIIVLLLFIYYIYLLHLLNSLKPDRFIYKLIISYSFIFMIFNIIEILGGLYNIWYQYFYYIFTTPIYTVPVIIYEMREAGNRKIEFNRIYQKLEKNKNQSLTESAEQKIERIISFLDENYISDISREGLASAVDMNHNYMSRLFYKHTGKKINEYINHLRISEAARLLKESDNSKRIIDIAFATGFENLSTFNRVFKDISGITPTEYKKKYNQFL